jgi:hypothetical protein
MFSTMDEQGQIAETMIHRGASVSDAHDWADYDGDILEGLADQFE